MNPEKNALAYSTQVSVYMGLLFSVATCCLIGCGGSPTTLAVENPNSLNQGLSTPNPENTASTITPTDNETGKTVPVTSSDPIPPRPETTTKPTVETMPGDVTETQLVGSWQDSFFGKRTLVLNADGSAKMILELDFAGQLLYGRRLEFDMQWSLEEGKVTIDILSGRPEKSAKSAIDTWGSRYEYLLDCVKDHQIEMRDADGSMNHVLRRIPEESVPATN